MISNAAQVTTSNHSSHSIIRNPKLHFLKATKIITENEDEKDLSQTALDAYVHACRSILQNVKKKYEARDFDGILKITATAKETFKNTDVLPTEAKKILAEVMYMRGVCLLSGLYRGIDIIEEAARGFEKAVQCNPEHREAAAALVHQKGRLAFMRGEVNKVVKFAELNGKMVLVEFPVNPPPTPPKTGMK